MEVIKGQYHIGRQHPTQRLGAQPWLERQR